MSPVIRLSDSTYNRLELHAIGFDAPNNVIERLIDFYESHHSNSQNSNSKLHETIQTTPLVSRSSPSKKKPRDQGREKHLREAAGKYLTRNLDWGKFELRSEAVLEYQNAQAKVLCKYSCKSENGTWFWGVGKKYWSEWDDNCHLVLLIDNEEEESCSFLFFKSKEAIRLLESCGKADNGQKKINLRLCKDGLLHLQEWQDYDVKKNIRKIGVDEPNEQQANGFISAITRPVKPLPARTTGQQQRQHSRPHQKRNASYIGKKTIGFNFNGEYYPVKHCVDILLKICEIMLDRHPNEFGKTVLGLYGDEYDYFSHDKSKLMQGQGKKVPRTQIYAATKLHNDAMIKRVELVIESFGYNSNDLKIETSD